MIGETIRTRPAECPVHGRYTSELWRLEHRRHPASVLWTACPVCVRQHRQANHGQGEPDLKDPHRPI